VRAEDNIEREFVDDEKENAEGRPSNASKARAFATARIFNLMKRCGPEAII
jgi:hypothetical protein